MNKSQSCLKLCERTYTKERNKNYFISGIQKIRLEKYKSSKVFTISYGTENNSNKKNSGLNHYE